MSPRKYKEYSQIYQQILYVTPCIILTVSHCTCELRWLKLIMMVINLVNLQEISELDTKVLYPRFVSPGTV